MKKSWVIIALMVVNSACNQSTATTANKATTQPPPQHEHSVNMAATVPAHFEVPPAKSNLGPTLDPEKFSGVTREAYRAVREIPVTIAQLPCYCHCDRGFGHKSLYSCFEDDHAAHCAVCTQEAVLALRLEKEQKLTPAQIRDTIVAQYSH
jgi:hypothetical protein